MPATVVVGTQWGDEGKGKFTDLVAKEMDVVTTAVMTASTTSGSKVPTG